MGRPERTKRRSIRKVAGDRYGGPIKHFTRMNQIEFLKDVPGRILILDGGSLRLAHALVASGRRASDIDIVEYDAETHEQQKKNGLKCNFFYNTMSRHLAVHAHLYRGVIMDFTASESFEIEQSVNYFAKHAPQNAKLVVVTSSRRPKGRTVETAYDNLIATINIDRPVSVEAIVRYKSSSNMSYCMFQIDREYHENWEDLSVKCKGRRICSTNLYTKKITWIR